VGIRTSKVGKKVQALCSADSLATRGAILGAITGCVLAAIYGGGVIAFLLALMTIHAPGTPIGDYPIQLAIVPVTATCAIPCVGVLGVAPGTAWGAMLGLLIGASVALLRKGLSPVTSALLGAAISAIVAVGWQQIFPFPTTTWIETRTYLLYQGVPGLISLVAGGWMARRLYRSVQD
jgi:hypothetical protein